MTNKKNKSDPPETIPPLELRSIILPFYTQALLKLGELTDPSGISGGVNLELAKRLIDLLDLLKGKTEGHLEDEEHKLLDQCLLHLKNLYLQKVDMGRQA